MKTYNQIRAGVAKYLDAEVLPHIGDASVNGFAVKVATAAAINYAVACGERAVIKYKDNKVVNALGMIDADGSVDIESFLAYLSAQMPEEGVKIVIPNGKKDFTFKVEDVQKLCQLMEG